MKHLIKILSSTVLAIMAIVLFNSCKGEKGPAGPSGADGNANVSSKVFSVSNWSNLATGQIYADITYSAVTQAILDSGSVIVYLNTAGYWSALPYTKYFSDHFIATSYQCSLNTVRIIVTESDLTNPPRDDLSIKVVVITGKI